MDKIFIKNLEIYGYHGVFKQEKDMGQRFLISLELTTDLREAGKSDNLVKTVNYAELCAKVEEKFKEHKFDLIERAAEYLAEFILIDFEIVKSVKVNIKKPWAPIGKPLDFVGVEIERAWHRVYICIGSNVGEKEKNIEASIDKINKIEATKVIKLSKKYVTKPVGYTEQDDFLNCVVEIKTLCTPNEMLDNLLRIEKELKRERIIRWGPRTIDLDILLFDNEIITEDNIIVPHPRMHERLFVLKPLCDIEPYLIHPVLGKRIFELSEKLSKEQSL